MNRNLIVIGLLTSLLALPSAQALTALEYLSKANKTLETELAKIRDSEEKSRVKLSEKYVSQLEALRNFYQKDGQLKPLVAARDELERFRREQTMALAEEDAPPDLVKLMENYTTRFQDLELTAAKKVVKLAGQYEQSLKKVEANYTKGNRIEEALTINTAREELAKRNDLARAQAVLKTDQERQALLAKSEPKHVPVVVEPEPEEQVVGNKFKGSDRKRISDQYKVFVKSLESGKTEDLVPLVQPSVREAVGTEAIKGWFAPFTAFMKVIAAVGGSFNTGKITISDDGLTAVQIPTLDTPKGSEKKEPMNWIKVDGDWYLDLDKDDTERKKRKLQKRLEQGKS